MSSARCASNPAEMKRSCGRKRSSAGSHAPVYARRSASPSGAGGQAHVHHVLPARHVAQEGVEPTLESGDHEHALVAGENVLGAVAVVHVEVDECHALQAQDVQRVPDPHRHVVEDAEAHGLVARRMVARRAHGAEGAAELAANDHLGAGDRGARGALRGGERVRIHRGIGIDVQVALARRGREDLGHVSRGVRLRELLARGERRLARGKVGHEARGDEVVRDRVESLRALGMSLAHLVAAAIGVGDQGAGHAWILRP
jgi:hypothetical protein